MGRGVYFLDIDIYTFFLAFCRYADWIRNIEQQDSEIKRGRELF